MLPSFRGRFILIGTLAILPFLAAIFLQARHDVGEHMAATRQQAQFFLQALVDHRSEPIQHIRTLLNEVGKSYDFVDADGCADLQSTHRGRHPWTRNLWLLGTDGRMLCETRSWTPEARTTQAYLEAVRRTGTFALMMPKGADSGATPAIAAMPVWRNGKIIAIAALAADRAWIGRQLSDIAGNSDTTIILGRPDGTVLEAYIQGKPDNGLVLTPQLAQALRDADIDAGAVSTCDGGGVRRVFVVTHLGNTGLNIAVGLPQERIADRLAHHLWQSLAIAGIVLLSSVALGFLGIELAILRPLGRFEGWLAAIGRGDYRARSPQNLSREFRGLAGALTRMSAEIQTREAQIRESESRFRLIAENMGDIIIVADHSLRISYASQQSGAVYGKTAPELIGRPLVEQMHPEYRAAFLATCQTVLDGQDPPPCIMLAPGIRDRIAPSEAAPDNPMWIEVAVRPMPDKAEGGPGGIVIVTRDVTARKNAEDKLAEANRQLHLLAVSDALTDLGNRRLFDETLPREWRQAGRRFEPLSMLMVDVDHFKKFNDRFGHLEGDACLRRVADAIRHTTSRPGDLATRYGGEEFAILLPNTDDGGALHLAERLRQAVRGLGIDHPDNPHGRVTVSIGVATIVPRRDLNRETLVARADRALYGAKKDGRNQVRQLRQDDFNLIQIPA
ncbi:MAG TPA: diguanylate cyclase [Stellaceae bacterium]|nr:diguanylate cyclase [Stellaceae bacterium]